MINPNSYNEQPTPEHPLKLERPDAIASLFVHTAEWPDLDRILVAHGPAEIVEVQEVPIIPALVIEVACKDQGAARGLMEAWSEFCETSPHRPHSEAECKAWGLKLLPEIADIPQDWTF